MMMAAKTAMKRGRSEDLGDDDGSKDGDEEREELGQLGEVESVNGVKSTFSRSVVRRLVGLVSDSRSSVGLLGLLVGWGGVLWSIVGLLRSSVVLLRGAVGGLRGGVGSGVSGSSVAGVASSISKNCS